MSKTKRRRHWSPEIKGNNKHGSEVHTDELRAYQKFAKPEEYTHKTVNHSQGEYVKDDGTTTNSIESFFNRLKKSIAVRHTSVSLKYLESYAKEFEYRFNRRMRPETMLGELLSRFRELNA